MTWRDEPAGKISGTNNFGSRGKPFGSNEIQLGVTLSAAWNRLNNTLKFRLRRRNQVDHRT
jgi:hypothetical protein